LSYRLSTTPAGRRYYDVRCDDCGRELVAESKYTLNEDGSWKVLQPDEGLAIEVSGGYAMFIDLVFSEQPSILLCRDCAIRACELLPWLKAAITPSINMGVGHCCPLRAGELIWESYWDCDCARAERERENKELERMAKRILKRRDRHRSCHERSQKERQARTARTPRR
jgi:hypothetical protein